MPDLRRHHAGAAKQSLTRRRPRLIEWQAIHRGKGMAAPGKCRRAGVLWLMLTGAAVAVPHACAADGQPLAKVPRFASLRSDEVNLRVGPGQNYPIEWVLTRKGMPVEIIAQFEHWRKVREPEGSEGWIQERMLTDQRTVMITSTIRSLHREPSAASGIVARAEPGVVATLLECRGEWCRINADRLTGWVRRGEIFGVLPDETMR